MKESVSPKIIIGAVVGIALIIGFFAYRMMSADKVGAANPTTSAQYMQRSSSGYGQAPPGTTRPAAGPGPGQPGYGGGRPMGYGGGAPSGGR